MMNLIKKLRKEILEYCQQMEHHLLESNYFNVLKERYQSLNSLKQKMIKYGLLSIVCICILYLPAYYLSSSIVSWLELKQKHKLSLGLLKVRENSSVSMMNHSKSIIKSKITQVVQKYSSDRFTVSQEQQTFSQSSLIEHILFNVSASHLNIRQAVQLGTELQKLPQIRLDELAFTENKEYKNHYDSHYKLSGFFLKQGASLTQKDSNKKRKPPRKRKKKNIKTPSPPSRPKQEKAKKLKPKKIQEKTLFPSKGGEKKNRLNPETRRKVKKIMDSQGKHNKTSGQESSFPVIDRPTEREMRKGLSLESSFPVIDRSMEREKEQLDQAFIQKMREPRK